MKKPIKKQNGLLNSKVTFTIDENLKIKLGPSAQKKVEETNKMLRDAKNLPK